MNRLETSKYIFFLKMKRLIQKSDSGSLTDRMTGNHPSKWGVSLNRRNFDYDDNDDDRDDDNDDEKDDDDDSDDNHIDDDDDIDDNDNEKDDDQENEDDVVLTGLTKDQWRTEHGYWSENNTVLESEA